MKIIKPCNIIFANDKVEKEFLDLDENDEIKKYIKNSLSLFGVFEYAQRNI